MRPSITALEDVLDHAEFLALVQFLEEGVEGAKIELQMDNGKHVTKGH